MRGQRRQIRVPLGSICCRFVGSRLKVCQVIVWVRLNGRGRSLSVREHGLVLHDKLSEAQRCHVAAVIR